jgi:hypothetical protein
MPRGGCYVKGRRSDFGTEEKRDRNFGTGEELGLFFSSVLNLGPKSGSELLLRLLRSLLRSGLQLVISELLAGFDQGHALQHGVSDLLLNGVNLLGDR